MFSKVIVASKPQRKIKSTDSADTLEPLQVTPSQRKPQGSFDLSQLGGVFCHAPFKDWSTAAATIHI